MIWKRILAAAAVLGIGGGVISSQIDSSQGIARAETKVSNTTAVIGKNIVDFQKDVQPILTRHCGKCHGQKKQSAGLRFDIRSTVFSDSDSGGVIKKGNSGESLIIQLVTHEDDEKIMPPKGDRLSANEINILRKWIDDGAVWPDKLAGTLKTDHWSLQPLKKPAVPKHNTKGWARNEIDQFVWNRLKAGGLTPNGEADRGVLIRRLTFDLTGLPPTPREVKAFIQDRDPKAYEKVIERLLASKHYGERWGRHWLDVARYTESQGFEYDRVRGNAWHYRDYVIRSFNDDKPYDQFVREQIAGDVMKDAGRDGVVATSFLVCGPYDQAGNSQSNKTQKLITREQELEDLISVVGQTLMGLTLNCARCHSHKYDPISQLDYYRIKSVFEGVYHGERSITSAAEINAWKKKAEGLRKQIAGLQNKTRKMEEGIRQAILAERKSGSKKVIVGPAPFARWTFDDGQARDVTGNLHGTLHDGAAIRNGRLIVNGRGAVMRSAPLTKNIKAKTLEAWVMLPTLKQGGGGVITLETNNGVTFDSIVFAERQPNKWMAGSDRYSRTRNLNAPQEKARSGELVHMAIVYEEDGRITLYRNGARYGATYRPSGSAVVYRKGSSRLIFGVRHTGGGRSFLNGEIDAAALYDRALSAEEIGKSYQAGGGTYVAVKDVLARLSPQQQSERTNLLKQIQSLEAKIGRMPRSAKSYVGTRRQPKPTRMLVRGDVKSPAQVVKPKALSIIASPNSDFGLAANSPESQRRLAFANWLTDKRHPTLARTMVNRIWHYHFGKGIVATPSDLGVSGERPSHPQLLDWLAATFIEKKFSIKAMHRLIVASATYRQASTGNAEAMKVDAGNRLLWRYAPRRLEAEAVRDAMLMVSGEINLEMGGPSFRPFDTSSHGSVFYHIKDKIGPQYNRRTIYRMNVNSGKDPLLDAFDCPDPAVKAPKRRTTVTPLQALGLMNNSFVQRQAKKLAERALAEARRDLRKAIDLAVWHAFGRRAQAEEINTFETLAKKHGLEQMAWVLINASEFIYVR